MYFGFDRKALIYDKTKFILSSNTIYVIAITLLVVAFSVFSICICNLSKLIVGTLEFNLWNIFYTIIEFLLGICIVSISLTMMFIRANANKNLEKSVNHIELINIFTSISIVLAMFFIFINGVEIILENIYLYNIAKSRGVISIQEAYVKDIVFDIFILCIILIFVVLTNIKFVQFLRGIENLIVNTSLDEKGIAYMKITTIMMSVIFIIIGMPIIGLINSENNILLYFIIDVCLAVSLIALSCFVFRTNDIYKQIRKMTEENIDNDYQNISYNNNNILYHNNVPVNVCPQCRNICRIDAKFCTNCGSQLNFL